ncbi:hypothetical protein Sjap_025844 [Stephania japonica]|uniref:Transcription elongation factor 1 homolog n=1 Tax=Stephania japonica TaxID=461633 RepID=A0AAP0EA91_9MAGN
MRKRKSKAKPPPKKHMDKLDVSERLLALVKEVFENMGKRKSMAKPLLKKPMNKLDTIFSCPFRNHGTSVECRIDMKNLIGEAICGICQESYNTTVNALTEPINIYSEWIGECEQVNTVDDEA